MTDAQLDLFPELESSRKSTKATNYGEFTDKFKQKLTTDDCYTPEPVYNAIRDWCVEKYGLQGRKIVRPFWPGGDFETFDYPENCVVIDNPPFSIYDKILNWFTNVSKIDFFLFGPSLTLFKRYDACYVVANETITYDNGAKVCTSFATSLDRANRIVCDPSLKEAIRKADKGCQAKKKAVPVIVYPESMTTSALLGKTSRAKLEIRKEDASWVTHVNGKRLFGSGFLLSDKAAADKAAEKGKNVVEYGPQEIETIRRLNERH